MNMCSRLPDIARTATYLVLANFSEHPQSVQGDLPFHAGLVGEVTDLLAPGIERDDDGRIRLESYGLRWLAGEGRL